jgi:hypothetical protein
VSGVLRPLFVHVVVEIRHGGAPNDEDGLVSGIAAGSGG